MGPEQKSSHCWELFQSMVRAKGRPRIRCADPHRLRPPAGGLASSLKTLRVFLTLVLLCNGLVLLKTYLLTVIMLAHRPRVSMSPYLFHPLAIVAVVTSKPLATTHAELNNNCKLKLQIHPTRLFYKTHCLDDQQSHQALTLNSFPANLRDCLRQLSIMRNQQ